MGFVEDIAKQSDKVRTILEQRKVSGEAQTKQALILPFLANLGYDPYDPGEVISEYASDPSQIFNGGSKGKPGSCEKVDYAIAINNTVVMLIEAKSWDQKLDKHHTQIGKYFTWTTSSRLAVITNGVEYRFFTDLGEKNMMDTVPFFRFNTLSYSIKDLETLQLFHRDNFSTGAIVKHAEEVVYVRGMTDVVNGLLRDPSDDFVKLLISATKSSFKIEGNIVAGVVEKFRPVVKKAIQNSLVEMMTSSISREMDTPKPVPEEPDEPLETETDKVITTDEELAAFGKIQAIVAKSSAHSHPLGFKDVESYFGVHLGKPGWWFLRLYLSPKRKSVVIRLPIGEVRSLADSFEVQEVSTAGSDAARVVIGSIEDLDRLSALVLKAYKTEAIKHSTKPMAVA